MAANNYVSGRLFAEKDESDEAEANGLRQASGRLSIPLGAGAYRGIAEAMFLRTNLRRKCEVVSTGTGKAGSVEMADAYGHGRRSKGGKKVRGIIYILEFQNIFVSDKTSVPVLPRGYGTSK